MTRLAAVSLVCLVSVLAVPNKSFACSCSSVQNFEQTLESAPLVVVGRLSSTGLVPPTVSRSNGVIEVRPFNGVGATIDLLFVVKGDVNDQRLTIWDVMYGECAGPLHAVTIGDFVVAALYRVRDVSTEARATWQGGRNIPPSDYVTPSACSPGLRVLSDDDVTAWRRRRLR